MDTAAWALLGLTFQHLYVQNTTHPSGTAGAGVERYCNTELGVTPGDLIVWGETWLM